MADTFNQIIIKPTRVVIRFISCKGKQNTPIVFSNNKIHCNAFMLRSPMLFVSRIYTSNENIKGKFRNNYNIPERKISYRNFGTSIATSKN